MSRYLSADLLRTQSGQLFVGRAAPLDGSVSFREYRTVEGDRLDLLAAEFLGDSKLWWRLAQMNPEVRTLETLPVATRLRVPYAVTS